MSKENESNFLVVKHNNLVEFTSKHSYSLNQLKLICHLISHIKPTDGDFEFKKVTLEELGITREKGLNYTFLKEDLESVFDKKIKLSNGFWVHWFSAFKYEFGTIEYRFDPLLKPYLLDIKENFTSYKLNNILSLQSTSSIRLYELLIQYLKVKQREMCIEELKVYLNLPVSYKNANVLQLLKKSQKELEEKTDLTFTFDVKKIGKKINKIIFFIKRNLLSECNKQSIACKKIIPNKEIEVVEDIKIKDKLKNLKINDVHSTNKSGLLDN